jgi:hypothetical protein
MATTFSAPQIDETINFLMPAIKMPASSALDGLVYLYSDNFMWIRYALLISAVLVLRKSTLIRKNQKTKIWLIITVLAFWLGYFLLKTSVQNPPEAAKDYRFGLFVDLSLIPLVGIILIEVIEKMKCVKIQLRLPRAFKEPKFSSKLPQFTVAIVIILIMTVPVYCGFNFDRIMERPFEAQGFGRYVVTDDKLQVMQYIQNKSGFKKSVILSDSHMGQIAQGALDMNFEKAKLFNLNSGAALYLYFNNMRRNPSIATMGELMNQTNAGIGFFVIGLNDWRGWLSQDAYWIDSKAIESLKVIANEWKVFGEKNDMFVFVFQKP